MFGRHITTGLEPYYHQIIEQIPSATLICNEDFTIRYMNNVCRALLRKNLPALIINDTQIFNFNLDKIAPTLRKQLLDRKQTSNPAKDTMPTLSMPANNVFACDIGSAKCDIIVSKCQNPKNSQDQVLMLTLSPKSDSLTNHDHIDILSLLNGLPHNVMYSDNAGIIRYVSESGMETFRRAQKFLPIPADKIVGANFDVFHKNPQAVRKVVDNKENYLHRTKIHLGEQIYDFRATPMIDKNGKRMGTIVTWSSFTFASDFAKKMKSLIDSLTASTNKFQEVAQSLASGAEETSQQTRSVAAASEELKKSVNNIARQISDASEMVRVAVEEATVSEKNGVEPD